MKPWLLFCLLFFLMPPFTWAYAEEGTSGLPIPRFVSFRYEEVNIRTGPGTRYPIRWVYKRQDMPMEVTEEFGHWRKVKDFEGDEGWVHKSQLSGNRTTILLNDTIFRRYPEADAPPMMRAEKGVIGYLLECDIQWCEVQIDSFKAWATKDHLWGIYSREIL